VKRILLITCALAVALPGVAGAAARLTAVDTSGYPTVRATVVTSTPVSSVGPLTENGTLVTGFEAANLGREKSVVLLLDRSQSMQGQALRDASAAARAFVRGKPRSDRISVVAVGTNAVQLTGFSSSTIDADASLRTLEVDEVRGTALYDGVLLSAQALAADVHSARVLVLLTDGQEVSSDATLAEAIAAARDAKVAVYPIAIESPSLSPAPLKKLAEATGGRYAAAATTGALAGIYAALAAELRRTWHLTYVTSARPGEHVTLAAAGASAKAVVPGVATTVAASRSSLPDEVYTFGPALVASLVGACILFGAIFLFRAPAGTALRLQISPHLGESRKKRQRGLAEERFATASRLLHLTEKTFGHLRVWHWLHRLLERADVPLRTVELVYCALGSSLVVGLLSAVAGAPPLLSLVAMAIGASLPILVVVFKARRRLVAIDDQLPDLLVTLAASLKAGHSFRQGIQAVVDEGLPPASKEFKRVLTETRLGRPMDDALNDMAERVGSKNLSFVVTAVTIQRQVGGSLAGIFDMVAEAVRSRQQFARKIRSLTAMGRASAYVLCGLPFFILGAITVLNPEYMDPLYHSSAGHKLVIVGLLMMAVGSLLLRKIVSFKG
jgi:tight adherence protein B